MHVLVFIGRVNLRAPPPHNCASIAKPYQTRVRRSHFFNSRQNKMALYKYVSADTALNILSDHTIRFTQPNAFNDPFEFLPQFYREDKHLSIRNYTARFDVIAKRRENIDKDWSSTYTITDNDDDARLIVNALSKEIGILCLTTTKDNLLMWAHYCDQYKGAVIEFNDRHDFFKNAFPIRYCKKRPIYNFSDFYEITVPVADLCVKSEIWKYENELRIAKLLSDLNPVFNEKTKDINYLCSIPPECIMGVTIGFRMPEKQQDKIKKLLKGTQLYIEEAKISRWDYALETSMKKPPGILIYSPLIS